MNFPVFLALGEQESAALGNMLTWVLILGAFMFVFWFSGRKQRKREKMMAERRKNLKNGDRVMMTCGIYGTVMEIGSDEDIVTIAVGPDKIPLVFNRAYIAVVEYDEDKVDLSKEESKESIKK